MTRNGKIARLPHEIREQLNQRLQDGHQAKPILQWLNSLLEVQAVLKAEFAGRPINAVNLTEWRKGGYRDWQLQQLSLQLVESLDDEHSLGHSAFAGPFTAKLARWTAIHLAATAQTLVAREQDPEVRWSRLRELCAQVSRLRRGDLFAERLSIDRDWLDLERRNTDDERQKEFWEWTERPEIHEKLFPDKEPGLSPETLEKIEREFNLMGDSLRHSNPVKPN